MGDDQQVTWRELGRAGGVRLLTAGSGPTVVLFPGMEGSGESCLHIATRVVLAGPGLGRLVLVDYSGERHHFLGALVDTIAGLLNARLGQARVRWWGQSFGNLLLGCVQPRVSAPGRATLLVSPFTGLPRLRLRAALAVLSVTPGFVYTATAPAVSRVVFGPAPRGCGDAFFQCLGRMAVSDLRRRAGWLRAGDFAEVFQALPGPLGVWFGDRDRLVDLPRQLAFFTERTQATGGQVRLADGCGHVLLPPEPVGTAVRGIENWFTALPSMPDRLPALRH